MKDNKMYNVLRRGGGRRGVRRTQTHAHTHIIWQYSLRVEYGLQYKQTSSNPETVTFVGIWITRCGFGRTLAR